MANGLYVMCANKSSVEQGHVVTGTFYPPVATSQDQQLLGATQNNNINTSVITSQSNIQYFSTAMQYYQKDYQQQQQYDHQQESTNKNDYLTYKPPLQDNSHSYKPMDDNNSYQQQDYENNIGSYNMPTAPAAPPNEERSDVDSDVDTREFDKYLKYGASSVIDSNAIDSNHNYHHQQQHHRHESTVVTSQSSSVINNLNSPSAYNYQTQHQSVILPNTNNVIKPEPFVAHCPEVYDLGHGPKGDDDFSEILAGVRKTCFSNSSEICWIIIIITVCNIFSLARN